MQRPSLLGWRPSLLGSRPFSKEIYSTCSQHLPAATCIPFVAYPAESLSLPSRSVARLLQDFALRPRQVYSCSLGKKLPRKMEEMRLPVAGILTWVGLPHIPVHKPLGSHFGLSICSSCELLQRAPHAKTNEQLPAYTFYIIPICFRRGFFSQPYPALTSVI